MTAARTAPGLCALALGMRQNSLDNYSVTEYIYREMMVVSRALAISSGLILIGVLLARRSRRPEG
jgi:hypothetical protein